MCVCACALLLVSLLVDVQYAIWLATPLFLVHMHYTYGVLYPVMY